MNLETVRKKCKRKSDYIITLFITNEISLVLVWVLLKTNITPNQVTSLSIISGVLCGILYASGYLFYGSFCLFLSHILDCTDGNLARASQKFHPKGKWYDVTGDRIREAAIFIGISIYFFRQNPTSHWFALSLLDGLLLILYYYIVDTKAMMGHTSSNQPRNQLRFKDVYIKWGLLEPVYYGFIILAPINLAKLQLTLVFFIVLIGLTFQFKKAISEINQ
jgi:phosphatidylglycerophosphate synthase